MVYPATLTLSAAITASTTQITNAGLVALPVGAFVRIDSEVIRIAERTGDAGSTLPANTVRVNRGWSSSAASHSDGSDIRRIFQELTTASQMGFNDLLPAGSASLEIRSVTEAGSFLLAVSPVPITIQATLTAPTVPVYTGPSTFTGNVILTWSSSATADTFVVFVQRNGSAFKNIQFYAGLSITMNELDSGYYQTENGVKVYYPYSYHLYLKARSGNNPPTAWSAAFPFSINRIAIAPPAAVTISTVPGSDSNVRKFEWITNAHAKFYEVYIGRDGATHGNSDFNMISAYVADDGIFYVAMPPGNYRVWLRAWNQEDSINSVSPFNNPGFAFSIA